MTRQDDFDEGFDEGDQAGKDFVCGQFFGLADMLEEELIIPRSWPGKPDHLDPATLEYCADQIRRLARLWLADVT